MVPYIEPVARGGSVKKNDNFALKFCWFKDNLSIIVQSATGEYLP